MNVVAINSRFALLPASHEVPMPLRIPSCAKARGTSPKRGWVWVTDLRQQKIWCTYNIDAFKLEVIRYNVIHMKSYEYIWYNRFMNDIYKLRYHQIHSNTWEGQTLPTPGEAKANCWFGTMGQCTLTACDRWNRRVSENSRWPAHVLLVFEMFLMFLDGFSIFLPPLPLQEFRNAYNACTVELLFGLACSTVLWRQPSLCLLVFPVIGALLSVRLKHCVWAKQSCIVQLHAISLSITPHCCIQYSSEIGCNIFYYMTLPSFSCLLHFAEVGNSEGQSKNISELAPPCCNHVQNCQVQLQVWPAWPAWCLVVWREFLPDAEWSAFLSQNDLLKKCLSPIWTEILFALVLGRKKLCKMRGGEWTKRSLSFLGVRLFSLQHSPIHSWKLESRGIQDALKWS